MGRLLADDPFGHGEVDCPAGPHGQRPAKLTLYAFEQEIGQMGQRLCARPEADRIATHHPGAVPGNVPTADSGKTEADEQDHRRAHHHPDDIKKRAVVVDGWIELSHPQA